MVKASNNNGESANGFRSKVENAVTGGIGGGQMSAASSVPSSPIIALFAFLGRTIDILHSQSDILLSQNDLMHSQQLRIIELAAEVEVMQAEIDLLQREKMQ